jgi:cytidylate kinase
MAVITISREFGSGGSRIADAVARGLDYHLIDKKTIGRLLAAYGLVEFDKEYDSEIGFWGAFDSQVKEMVSMLNRVTRALARHGNVVILGRGAFAVLRGYSDVLNVRIQAPLEDRLVRVMAEMEISERSKAEELLREGDRVRSSFVHTMYGLRWDASSAFDLVVDTSKVAPETAASWITEAARKAPAGRKGSRTIDIEADATLDETIASELLCRKTHRQ